MNQVKVRRANVILRVNENQVDAYLAKGFGLLNDEGHIVKTAVPTDIQSLQKAYRTHVAKIQKLEAELDALKKPTVSGTESVEEESTPKRKRSRKLED